jgi:hypothetical protein
MIHNAKGEMRGIEWEVHEQHNSLHSPHLDYIITAACNNATSSKAYTTYWLIMSLE